MQDLVELLLFVQVKLLDHPPLPIKSPHVDLPTTPLSCGLNPASLKGEVGLIEHRDVTQRGVSLTPSVVEATAVVGEGVDRGFDVLPLLLVVGQYPLENSCDLLPELPVQPLLDTPPVLLYVGHVCS